MATPRQSAGILLYRNRGAATEVLLVHPGGPFWKNKDDGSWTIPKGEPSPGEELLDAAKREFREETGFAADGDGVPLAPVRQSGGKIVHAWAIEGDCKPEELASNSFTIEWPPCSGRMQSFPEVDRAAWFRLDDAKRKINRAQIDLLDQLAAMLSKIARR